MACLSDAWAEIFTGRLIDRFDKVPITVLGTILIVISSIVALQSFALGHFWGALILLELGWNFSFVGATSMVTDCYIPAERTKVQTFNELLIFGVVAIVSFSSGGLLLASGWNTINWIIQPVTGITLLILDGLAPAPKHSLKANPCCNECF